MIYTIYTMHAGCGIARSLCMHTHTLNRLPHSEHSKHRGLAAALEAPAEDDVMDDVMWRSASLLAAGAAAVWLQQLARLRGSCSRSVTVKPPPPAPAAAAAADDDDDKDDGWCCALNDDIMACDVTSRLDTHATQIVSRPLTLLYDCRVIPENSSIIF